MGMDYTNYLILEIFWGNILLNVFIANDKGFVLYNDIIYNSSKIEFKIYIIAIFSSFASLFEANFI